jgi:dihydrofolate synthase/folylpolyglutamate synthase
MTYQETLDFLYTQLPVFHRIGAAAYKKDLTRTEQLLEHLGNPHYTLNCVHVAGTNGKGSSSHFLASILQEAGYKTGLYTSPHLKHFGERICIDGAFIEEEFVIQFVKNVEPLFKKIFPSFFELTVAMAFQYFHEKKVDIVVVETGLGGRLDSTNVIQPIASLITNISYDHVDILGTSLKEIAFEKAGIIKPNTPIVISERQSESEEVFREVAAANRAPIVFASDHVSVEKVGVESNKMLCSLTDDDRSPNSLISGLVGQYQLKNIAGVWIFAHVLNKNGISLSDENIKKGVANVILNTGLKGRWQVIGERPLTVCDIAHNEAGISALLEHISSLSFDQLHIVLGMVRDKDISKVLPLLPKNAWYYFTQSQSPRALPAEELQHLAQTYQLEGGFYLTVNQAIASAQQKAKPEDFVLVCGSAFVIAEVEEV